MSASPGGAGPPLAIPELEGLSHDAFMALLGPVFEHSPWVAERARDGGPFPSVDHLHAAMMSVIRHAPAEEVLALLRAHPELGGQEARAGAMTAASTGEQGRLGFDRLSADEQRELDDLNRRYRERFGFPCIIALRRHATREGVVALHRERLGRDRATEIAACLDEIAIITRRRLDAVVTDRA